MLSDLCLSACESAFIPPSRAPLAVHSSLHGLCAVAKPQPVGSKGQHKAEAEHGVMRGVGIVRTRGENPMMVNPMGGGSGRR